MNTAENLINILLSPSVQRQGFNSMTQWFEAFNQQARPFESPLDRAFLGGRISVNLSFAFAAGYQSAIEALFQPEKTELAAFCVSETQGNHPRAIETSLVQDGDRFYISGNKSFVSGAGDAQSLYIACRDRRVGDGLDDAGRPLIKVVRVAADQPGVLVQTLPALKFVPEIAHGKVDLQHVQIEADQILPGDGYLDYVKAFRTYEDLHVLAAITAYRLGEAVQGQWPELLIEAHLPVMLGLRALAEMDLLKPASHIALAAVRSQFDALLIQTDPYFETHHAPAFSDWQRDKAILSIASQAHQKRTRSAWQMLFLPE